MLPRMLRDTTAARTITDTATSTPKANAVPKADADGTLNKWASGAGMPGGRFINYGFPASGSTVSASADGYFILAATMGQYQGHVALMEGLNGTYIVCHAPEWNGASVIIPTKKGSTIGISHTGNTGVLTNGRLTFVYAEGAKP